jgi:sugar phosphate isomerase/epimerase
MSDYRFKIGMDLQMTGLPFDEALALAEELGVRYGWFGDLHWAVDEITDATVDGIGERAARHDVELFMIGAGGAFSKLHLADLALETIQDPPEFRKDFDHLTQTMQIANRLGVGSVLAYTFAWPGEYSAGKPTWPMRWLTRGGVVASVDMEKLVKVFALVAEQAEKYNIDVVLGNLPWHYTNTTGHCRELIERLDSKRIKIMWHPSDNLTAGESDSATAGFINVRPYLHSLHVKDLRVIDGLKLKFEYCPLGEGDVDYPSVLRNLRDHRCDVVFAVATHFLPPSGSGADAMRINFANLKPLISQVEAGG